MTRPRLLDLYCGAGGAGMGYNRAGFDVTGVDITDHPDYPYELIVGDALEVMASLDLSGYDVIHASPPCQAYSGIPNRRTDHTDLLDLTRNALKATGLPYVLENVPGAPMPDAFILCGSTFGLPIIRHRLFETHPRIGLVPSSCHQSSWGRGQDHGPGFYPYAHGSWRAAWLEHVLPVVWPWMTLEEASQAIPPAYTEFIGHALLDSMEVAA